ncbi:MAG TPA: glycosyltransferase [Candidatus Saccharimonadales bacterium]|nr:glycosyltransferase [Candidatus Saccharimonadales bacterium]
MKIALTYDWLTNIGGAERVLFALHEAYPDAPIFVSAFEPTSLLYMFNNLDVRTTYIQKLPKPIRRRHQLLPVVRAHSFRQIDLKDYDVVISSASAEAKAVRVRKDAVHICYCHTPTRYYWSHYEEYRRNPGFGNLDPFIRPLIPPFVKWMRHLDMRSVQGVDYFIANSHAVQKRIKKYYHRDSTVIFPPVDIRRFKPERPVKKGDYYLVSGRQNTYKRFDIAIEACNRLGRRLIVVGDGTEHEKLVKIAGPTIEFVVGPDDQEITKYFQGAKALLWPQVEDFGIVLVEALAAGTPVIAYEKDGALDTMIDGVTGLFFKEQTVSSLCKAIKKFETMSFSAAKLQKQAEKFSEEQFQKNIHKFVASHRKKPA